MNTDLSESRIIDRNAVYRGISIQVLMEKAGKAVAAAVSDFRRGHVVIFCGRGNNGGDGFAAAAFLRDRFDVRVIMSERDYSPPTPLLRSFYEGISDLVGDGVESEAGDTVIVDALLGSGISRPAAGNYAQLIARINELHESGAAVVSVDVPSGFPFSPAVTPDATVMMQTGKEGVDEKSGGKLIIADIGIPEKAVRYTGPGEMLLYPLPGSESHKGNNGIVTVIGGGKFCGAPVFSSLAAYRTGADLVYTLIPPHFTVSAAAVSPNLMVFPASAERDAEFSREAVIGWIERSTAVAVGMGMVDDAETSSFLERIFPDLKCPCVLDAGAIPLLSRKRERLASRNVVATPHSGEFEKLTGEKPAGDLDARGEQVREWASRLGITILLKGRIDVISDGKHVKFNDTGNPGMTVGGTGDVLTGVVAALMSKGCSPFNAARLGAFMNGRAGDMVFESRSFGLLATDLIEAIPSVIVQYTGKHE